VNPTPVPPHVRALLVCPDCRGELSDIAGGLICVAEARFFPVEGGVPFLVAECARTASPSELAGAEAFAPGVT